jgi:hypothetical protein
VYVHAHRHQWRRWRDPDGLIRYNVSDVGETMMRHAA